MENKQDQEMVAQTGQESPVEEKEVQEASQAPLDEIAQSKKYRKRAQLAEKRLEELESKMKKDEESKLAQKEEWRTLAEKREKEIEELKVMARQSALEALSEDDRELLQDLPTEKLLKYAERSRKIIKTNEEKSANTVAPRKNPFTASTAEERQKNWTSILKSYTGSN
jgi:hypothetical protein